MVVGFDLDGTITLCSGFGASEKNIPWWIIGTVLFFYKPKINERIILIIRAVKKIGWRVIIVTKRPVELKKLTKNFLLNKKIPYDEIYFVGGGSNSNKKKIEKIEELKPLLFFDNNKDVVKKLEEKGVCSILV